MKDPVKSAIQKTFKAESLAVASLGKTLESDVPKAVKLLSTRTGRIVITAVGKPSFVGMKLAASLTSLGYPAAFLHPVEAVHGDLGLVRSDIYVLSIRPTVVIKFGLCQIMLRRSDLLPLYL